MRKHFDMLKLIRYLRNSLLLKKPQARYLIPNWILTEPLPEPVESQLKFHHFFKIHFNIILTSQYLSSKPYIPFLICLLQVLSIALTSSVLFALKQSDVLRRRAFEPSIPWNTVIPRLTKIIRSGITFVSRNLR